MQERVIVLTYHCEKKVLFPQYMNPRYSHYVAQRTVRQKTLREGIILISSLFANIGAARSKFIRMGSKVL